MNNGLFSRASCSFLCFLFCLSPSAAAPADDARDLFELMNNRFSTLSSLSYTVNRVTTSGKQTVEEKWDLKHKDPEWIKVEYFKPLHRHLVINENSIWEYIPSAKRALKTDLEAMPQEKRMETIMSILTHVSVDGLRLGSYSNLLGRVSSVSQDNGNITIVHGRNPKFVVHADREKGTLIHYDLYDEAGDLVMQTKASQFIKVGPDFWFPQDIKALYRTDKGLIKSQISISNIRVNELLPDELFQFNPPEGVEVISP